MNLIKLSEKEIRDYIEDVRIYHRGRMYFFNGYVRNIKIDESRGWITATVHGNQDYTVEITMNAYKGIHDESCTCPYYQKWEKPCKHIAAVLFEAMRIMENKHIRYRNNHLAVNTILNKIENMGNDNDSAKIEQLHLLPALIIPEPRGDEAIRAYLELRIGAGRPYVVKSAEEFMECWVNGKRMVYGAQLTLDSTRQFFSGRDKAIMEILLELYTTHNEISLYSNEYRFHSLIKGKRFQLLPTHLGRFLDVMCQEAVTAAIFSKDLEIVPITTEPLPVTFEIRRYEEWLSVKYSFPEMPVELIPGGSYYYYQGKIYKITDTQKKYMQIIHEGFKHAGSNEMTVPSEYQERFISEVVPLLKKTGDVMVSPSLKKKIVQETLRPEIYLDQYKKGISARVIFHYGRHKVNPTDRGVRIHSGDCFILRDMEKEQKILDFLYRSGFYAENDQFCILKKEDIYHFVFERLSDLQEMSDVYYSEDFKKVTVRRNIKVSARVSLVNDLLEISFDTENLDKNELKDILEAFRKRKKFFRLKDGAILPLEQQPGLEGLSSLAEQMNIGWKELDDGLLQLPKHRALYLDSLIQDSKGVMIGREDSFRQLVESISTMKDRVFPVPKSLVKVLRGYQKAGFQWLKVLAQNGLGGILADDMGLGKTLQVLALILSEKRKHSGPSLVITPTSLVHNWVLESEKFTPKLKVTAISGNQEQRTRKLKKLDKYDLVITSYPLIRRDIEYYKEYHFSFCILDEAQHIKNHFTQSARAVRQIVAGNRFALTGTPMENSLYELWAIFDFLMPSYLFSRQKFQERFVKPMLNNDQSAAEDLKRHIRPFILRRMKKDVLKELPEKIETTITCEMTEVQKKVYLAFLAQVREEIASNIEEQGFERSQIQILAALTRLRQICCHPSTFLEDYEGGSGKLNLLEEITGEALESGHRILLFSQFTSMLDIIEGNLKEKEIPYFYLSGQTPAANRSQMVTRFNEGEGQIFLLSLKAGGTGLNLTGADTVIHFDPWWNPAVEEQATDRAYRIGQDKVVQVFKLVTRNTIEEKILLLQGKKKEMIDMVIKPGETMLQKLTKEEIQQLFT